MTNVWNSTRNNSIRVSTKTAILQGLARDGGLFVCSDLGKNKLDLERFVLKNYSQMAQSILKELLPDYTESEIALAVQTAYTNTFDTKEVTPLVRAGEAYFLELFHGPTSAFKDIGLQLLPQLMSFSLQEYSDKKVMILVATSGDTGKASLEGFQNIPRIAIAVFYPKDGTSQIQQLQMTTHRANNTAVFALQGTFDDAQSQIKALFCDSTFQQRFAQMPITFSTANSINIGRLAPQIVYYFYAYMQLVKQRAITLGEEINFCIPTGNFGNALAGYYARRLGLPIHKLLIASNENHSLTDFFQTGIYDRRRTFHKTNSPSMDILISSNLERLLYDFSEHDSAYVATLMNQLDKEGFYRIKQPIVKQMQKTFYADYCSDELCKQAIREVFTRSHYVMDPHTAVAYKVMKRYQKRKESRLCVVLSTASPYKFSQTVCEALYGSVPQTDEFTRMQFLSEKTGTPIPKNLVALQKKPILHKTELTKAQLQKTVMQLTDQLLLQK